MANIIHHLRKKPEHIRRHILHLTVGVCAVLLILIWIYTLGATLGSPETKTGVAQDLKPFAALKDNIIGGYNSLSQPASSIQGQ